MKEKDYSQFTDQQLLDKSKKDKNSIITRYVLIGLLMGISFYITLKDGIGFFTFFPLFFVFILSRNLKSNGELLKEIKSRNLK